MTNLTIASNKLSTAEVQSVQKLRVRMLDENDLALPTAITKAASKQTFYTIKLLVDPERVTDAYRAYAYFRWVDDSLDAPVAQQSNRVSFLEHQQMIIDCAYQGHWPSLLTAEERMVVELIRTDREQNSGLQDYIRHMLAVMEFDAYRRGKLISAHELATYTRHLAVAVTEAMHYFIGHNDSAPCGEARYFAVTAAHITHMLRDTCDDVAAGYYNIPQEFLLEHGIDATEVNSDAYREWVKNRVELARTYFKAGRDALAQANRRCRIAGYAYMARFEGVLDAIEREGYRLRAAYPELKHLGGMLKMSWSVLGGLVRA